MREIAPLRRDELAGQNTITSADRLDLDAALVRLEPAARGLLAMRYLAGLTAEEIGVATGLTASGVRTRLSRLIARMREDLDHD